MTKQTFTHSLTTGSAVIFGTSNGILEIDHVKAVRLDKSASVRKVESFTVRNSDKRYFVSEDGKTADGDGDRNIVWLEMDPSDAEALERHNAGVSLAQAERALKYHDGRFTRGVETTMEEIEKFTARLLENPQYAMEWSSGTFETAAKHKVYKIIVHCRERGESFSSLHEQFMGDVLQGARYNASSSSAPSNIAEQELKAAKAGILEDLKYAAKAEEEVAEMKALVA